MRPNQILNPGSHTYLAISKKLDEIISEYELNCKVNFIVTDNGSNFVKAFKEFSVVGNIEL